MIAGQLKKRTHTYDLPREQARRGHLYKSILLVERHRFYGQEYPRA
jgi:hypothetical protein